MRKWLARDLQKRAARGPRKAISQELVGTEPCALGILPDRDLRGGSKASNIEKEHIMNAKLLGVVTAAALLGSLGVASAQEPMQLTDAQLDTVTSGSFALVLFLVTDATTSSSVFLQASPTFAEALVSGTFTSSGPHPSLTIISLAVR